MKVEKLFPILLGALLSLGCVSAPAKNSAPQAPKELAPSGEYFILRSEQLRALVKGASIGIISGSASETTSIFMTAALEARGITVREINLYSMIPGMQLTMIGSGNDFTYVNQLAKDANTILLERAKLAEAKDFNMDTLIDKVLKTDNIVSETMRTDHYLTLLASLAKTIDSLNVGYIMVVGGGPQNFRTVIYDVKNYDVVYSNFISASLEAWRDKIPKPALSEHKLSYQYEPKKEPGMFFTMSYCEYIVSKMTIEGK